MPLEQNLLEAYLETQTISRGLSVHTIAAYEKDLKTFEDYTSSAFETTPKDIEKYMQAQAVHAIRTQARRLSAVRGFYKYLLEQGHIKKDPTAKQETPKIPQSLPKSLTEDEILNIKVPEVIHPLDQSKSAKFYKNLRTSGFDSNYIGRIITNYGDTKYVEVS